jgi:hypothetical protein
VNDVIELHRRVVPQEACDFVQGFTLDGHCNVASPFNSSYERRGKRFFYPFGKQVHV